MIKLLDEYVSRETISAIYIYIDNLIQWNNKFNLIRFKDEEDLLIRHIIDSVQLIKFINNDVEKIIDLGSGAGLPALIIAISRRDINIKLIESDRKKSIFLNEIIRILKLNCNVVNDRIENVNNIKSDIVTSRALSDLKLLLDYSFKFMHDRSKLIFLKGIKLSIEIEDAKKYWEFDYKIFNSVTDQNGKIIIIENLKSKDEL